MSNKGKERRCKSCKKLLLDEKLFCRRCALKGRNKFVEGFAIITSIAACIFGVSAIIKNNFDSENNSIEDDEDEQE